MPHVERTGPGAVEVTRTGSPSRERHPRYRPHADVAVEVVGTELLLVQLARGTTFRLNDTGRAVWDLAVTGLTAAEIAERLSLRLGAAPERLRHDTSQILEELEQSGLLLGRSEGDR
jgi:hypothetical protein